MLAAHVELEERMARRQRHVRHVCGVPRADDDPARAGVGFDGVDGVGKLVDALAGARECKRVFVACVLLEGGSPTPPLVAVDGTELAGLIGPRVPDRRILRKVVADIGAAAQKPEQLAHDAREQHLLRGEQRKALSQVVAGLGAKDGERASSCAVVASLAFVENAAHEVVILLHGFPFVTGATHWPSGSCVT